jgi:hypothetical protein
MCKKQLTSAAFYLLDNNIASGVLRQQQRLTNIWAAGAGRIAASSQRTVLTTTS